jgi:hypothetical protein
MATGTTNPIGFWITSQSPLDEKYLKEAHAYVDQAEVLAHIPLIHRSEYLLVNIAGTLYWFLPDLVTLAPVDAGSLQTASEIEITDAEGLFTATTVEGALIELAQRTEGASVAGSGNIYALSFIASNSVAGRLVGYTPPAGWTVTAGASPQDMLITHGLGRRVAQATVFEVTGTEELKAEGFNAYTGIKSPDANSVLIMGLTNKSVALKIYLFLV